MAMRFSILGTGSSGNAALLVTENARSLVDAGFSCRRLTQMITALGESIDRLDAEAEQYRDIDSVLATQVRSIIREHRAQHREISA